MQMKKYREKNSNNGIYIGYCRVSTKEQVKDSESLENQENIIKQYFEREKITNYKIFKEYGKSGTNTLRPKYQEMINLIVGGLVYGVVAVDTNRLHRNARNSSEFLEICRKYDTKLFNPQIGKIDIESSSGKMTYGMKSLVAEDFSNLLSESTLRGNYGKAISGKYPFKKTIYGYDKNEDHFLIQNKIEADAIKYLFENLGNLKPKEIYNKMSEMTGKVIKWDKFRRIVDKYEFYSTGKYLVSGKKIKLVEPLLDDIYGEVVFEYKNNAKKTKVKIKKCEDYIFDKKVYWDGERLTNKSGYGKLKKKYFYYYSEKKKKNVSQVKLIKLVEKSLLIDKEEQLNIVNELNNKLNKEIIEMDKYLRELPKYKVNVDNIEKINYTIENNLENIEIEYKKIKD